MHGEASLWERFVWGLMKGALLPLIYGIAEVHETIHGRFF
jgi:hypothetical protein